jgi:predicted PurR-regulated permease PerM
LNGEPPRAEADETSTAPAASAIPPPAAPFAARLLFGLAALTIVLAGLHTTSGIVGPVFLALVLTVTVHPVRIWLERHRIPGWATSLLMLVVVYLILVLLALALLVSVAQLANLMPQYVDQMTDVVMNAARALEGLGVDEDQIKAIEGAIDPGQLLDLVGSLLAGTFGVVTDLFFLVTVLLFMAFDTNTTRRNLTALARRFPAPVSALGGFAKGTRSYMGVSAGFGLIVAVVDGVALYLLDVPGAFVWAVLAFVTNFIPNIGFVIGLVPPAFIALLDSGPGLMVTVILLYSVINFVIQSVIQPRVVGDVVGLSPTLTFLSLVFWAWLIGPLGALLAVPLSLLMRSLLVEADPRGRWALPLISGKPDPPPLGVTAP